MLRGCADLKIKDASNGLKSPMLHFLCEAGQEPRSLGDFLGAHERAGSLPALDMSICHEPRQSLADRDPAHPVASCQFGLGRQTVARLPFAALDACPWIRVGLVVEGDRPCADEIGHY